MKHVRQEELKSCIFKTFDEFKQLIETLTGGLLTCEYEYDGLSMTPTEKSKTTGTEWTEDITETLSKYFGVTVTSYHADDSDLLCVWICYRPETQSTQKPVSADVILVEKPLLEGLTICDITEMYRMLNSVVGYPIELSSKSYESTAMGFITPDAAERLDFDYEKSGLQDFVGSILEDMNLESPSHLYNFRGLTILLTR